MRPCTQDSNKNMLSGFNLVHRTVKDVVWLESSGHVSTLAAQAQTVGVRLDSGQP